VGVYGESSDGVGVDGYGGALAGYFVGDVVVTGSCCISTLSAYAVNGSSKPLHRGQAVTVIAVRTPVVGSVPLLVVVPARAGQVVTGVVDRGMRLVTVGASSAAPKSVLSSKAGRTATAQESGPVAAPRAYLSVAISGLVEASVKTSGGPVVPGDRLMASSSPGMFTKAIPVQLGGRSFYAPGTGVGIALSEPDKTGLVRSAHVEAGQFNRLHYGKGSLGDAPPVDQPVDGEEAPMAPAGSLARMRKQVLDRALSGGVSVV
jgi:hypothetical protein